MSIQFLNCRNRLENIVRVIKLHVTYLRNGKETTVTDCSEECMPEIQVLLLQEWTERWFLEQDLNHLAHPISRSFNVDYGVKVTELNDGKFKDLGIKRGYIILSVNGKKVKNPADVRQFTNNESTLKVNWWNTV